VESAGGVGDLALFRLEEEEVVDSEGDGVLRLDEVDGVLERDGVGTWRVSEVGAAGNTVSSSSS
jgi:hypothetical protein